MRPAALARIRTRYGKLILVCLAGAVAAANNAVTRHVGILEPGEFAWEPELSPSGPLVVIISLADQTLGAYRNGIRIAYSSISSGVKGRSTRPVYSQSWKKRSLTFPISIITRRCRSCSG